ncbi:MAG: TIGR00730 family Rossman fold protein [Lactobacillus sp.]|jgi:uncharacterized protein (TIGR00730 family)|uniref:Cytokinin riboside 5'-monophosphate phosphoribohydrolase n=1 Tax=Lacticaseibacillus suilingensis TaxID=2799577 RepID=A0ABW4BIR0_9LACO|nr:TIGR00730 family Rossman fold protein [Lacticaseibacillus suilingensis]MCI1894718.1 TIGR00730 family Rossman fold protein [Lactobacillus sp.]MCI1940415.1 TIGR00730 family Rossman fold protein [Lactobacillus sp.]MCI1972891.1 TIGR00730 family Rossman fold protein [Lactobacillus sp.]MCI2016802.1 TIGR00730 family Rossman fold protein [Lactobacillus sp.]
MKNMAVYCGAYAGADQRFTQAAQALGQWLVAHDYALVYGGGGVGLMHEIATSVLAAGGTVTGIMPENLVARGAAMPGLTHFETVPDMAVRKARMLALADVCVALPGGVGTLEEISEAFSWARVGDNASPCIFFNVNGYYDRLAAFFDQMVMDGFLSAADRSKVLFTSDFNEMAQFIAEYQPPKVRQYHQHH